MEDEEIEEEEDDSELKIDKNKKKKDEKKTKKEEKERKFECRYEGCDKKFSLKWILNRHINSHFLFKMFRCEICGKAYKSKENMQLHFTNKHLGIKPYKCIYCEKSFSHRNGKFFLFYFFSKNLRKKIS